MVRDLRATRGSTDMTCSMISVLVMVLALAGDMFPSWLKVEVDEVNGAKSWPAMEALPSVF